LVTSRDVARAAGVSQATVSRVLAGSPRVTDATRARVLAALTEVGYVPNAAARTMRTRRTGSIGVVVARITNPFYPELLTAFSAKLDSVGRRMVLWDSSGPGEQSAAAAAREGVVDGLVFTTAAPESRPLIAALARQAAIVLVNRSLPDLACDQLTSDNATGGERIAAYFAANGHTRCGMICGPAGFSTSDEREAGFRAGLRAAGLELHDEAFVRGEYSHADGHAAMRQLLALDPPPTAVFCANDLIAMGALDAARALGVRVPDDAWVVGYDDIPMAAWEAFDLTTVRQPVTEIADRAVDRLLGRIADAALPPLHHRFPADVIVRRSTAHTAA
jgi:LacI family transcriptional regulator